MDAEQRPIGLTILRPIADAMLSHANTELPNEACGILSGSLADGVASAFHPARNAEASPLRYSVHPEDLGKVIGRGGRTARALRTVVGALGGKHVRVDLVDVDEVR